MKKIKKIGFIVIIIFFILTMLLWSFPIFGSEGSGVSEVSSIARQSEISFSDLGLNKIRVFPGNIFYPVKILGEKLKDYFFCRKDGQFYCLLKRASERFWEAKNSAARGKDFVSFVDQGVLKMKQAEEIYSSSLSKKNNQSGELEIFRLIPNQLNILVDIADYDEKNEEIMREKAKSLAVIFQKHNPNISNFDSKNSKFSFLRTTEALQFLNSDEYFYKTNRSFFDENQENNFYALAFSELSEAFNDFPKNYSEIIFSLPGFHSERVMVLNRIAALYGRYDLVEGPLALIAEKSAQKIGWRDCAEKILKDSNWKNSEALGRKERAEKEIKANNWKNACLFLDQGFLLNYFSEKTEKLADSENVLKIIEGAEKKLKEFSDKISSFDSNKASRIFQLRDLSALRLESIKAANKAKNYKQAISESEKFYLILNISERAIAVFSENKKEKMSFGFLEKFKTWCLSERGLIVEDSSIFPFCLLPDQSRISAENKNF